MIKGKSIHLFMLDNEITGRIKCTLTNWNGLVFKVPRLQLKACCDRKELNQTGVYFLFGEDENTGQHLVYVGQASKRSNGGGLLQRLQEHNRDFNKQYWKEAILITTSNDCLGVSEITYLEHKFCELARQVGRYIVKNGNTPSMGNISEEKEYELNEFIQYVRLILASLGICVFVELEEHASSQQSSELLYCRSSGCLGIGKQTNEGFLVKKDSQISQTLTPSCPKYVKVKREEYRNSINNQGFLIHDVLFSSPSAAASFICGASRNGLEEWKNSEGLTLRQIEQR